MAQRMDPFINGWLMINRNFYSNLQCNICKSILSKWLFIICNSTHNHKRNQDLTPLGGKVWPRRLILILCRFYLSILFSRKVLSVVAWSRLSIAAIVVWLHIRWLLQLNGHTVCHHLYHYIASQEVHCVYIEDNSSAEEVKRRLLLLQCSQSTADGTVIQCLLLRIRYLPLTIEPNIFFFFITRSSEIVSQCHWPLIIIINIFFLVNDCCRVSEEMAIKTAITLAITTLREILLLVPFFGNVQ